MKDQKSKAISPKKVLVVDDDRDILEIVQLILINGGFDVFTHTSGLKVEEAVNLYNPDVILLDIGLPGKQGTEVCIDLKKTHSMPIIFFSAHADKRLVYKQCNADGFIQKPFDINQLVNYVRSYVN